MKTINIAQNILLEPTDITIADLQRTLAEVTTPKVDLADLYLEYTHSEAWGLEDGIVKNSSFAIDKGFGLRAISGATTAFAYADEITLSALKQAAAVCKGAKYTGETKVAVQNVNSISHNLYQAVDPLISLSELNKVNNLRELDALARNIDSRVKQVIINLAGSYKVVLILASDGTLAADIRPLVRLNVTVIAEQHGRYETGTAGGGGRTNYNLFWQNGLAEYYVQEAVRIALLNLEAKPAPAGIMPVVLGPGWAGVLLHEAVGHGLEGDFIRKKNSIFAGKIGKQVASPICTIVDNGKLTGNLRGSLNIDDEGVPTQETVLIENGILKSFMYDKLNASLMNTVSSGNGRRESYSHIPIPRMTNTYMLAGKYVPEEILASVDKGIYAVNFSGGEVDITSGKFVFSTSEAYLIEHGKISYPLKGATLIGDGPSVLTKVIMLGNDLKLDTGVGTCGKEGQGVPVGVGQPTLKIAEIVIGGTK